MIYFYKFFKQYFNVVSPSTFCNVLCVYFVFAPHFTVDDLSSGMCCLLVCTSGILSQTMGNYQSIFLYIFLDFAISISHVQILNYRTFVKMCLLIWTLLETLDQKHLVHKNIWSKNVLACSLPCIKCSKTRKFYRWFSCKLSELRQSEEPRPLWKIPTWLGLWLSSLKTGGGNAMA